MTVLRTHHRFQPAWGPSTQERRRPVTRSLNAAYPEAVAPGKRLSSFSLKAREYELTAVSLAEAAHVSAENEPAAVAFTVAAIVLREIAHALEKAA